MTDLFRRRLGTALCSLCLCQAAGLGAADSASTRPARWGNYVEPDFPFYSSVVDAHRLAAEGWPTNNLTPRGLILKPGPGLWACFDTELLRVAVIWEGDGLTPVGMAPGSYHDAGHKAQPGETELPEIRGRPWIASGLYPGWQSGAELNLSDPRPPAPDVAELARGPLDPALARFRQVRLTSDGVALEYVIAGSAISERMEMRSTNGHPALQRAFTIGPRTESLWLVLGQRPAKLPPLFLALTAQPPVAKQVERVDGVLAVKVEASREPVELRVALSLDARSSFTWGIPSVAPPPARWSATIVTRGQQTAVTNGFGIDHVELPQTNPWRRNVRLGDLAFRPDGRAAVVTFDGDVWRVDGLQGDLRNVTWRRFASGLHEPLGIAARDGDWFVHDRNGIWRLRDTDGNGEADVHELFSNAFAQTAETREFATGLRLAPDGSFIIAKGGIQATARGLHNGSVLRIAPDGRSFSVLGHGLRGPFIGVHPRTGLVTASDQQGNYVPATPIHLIRDHQFYGYLTGREPRDYTPPPVAEPLTWIPHPVNASGVGQVWLDGARMGPLNDALIHLGYYRPEVFVVRWNERGSVPQAAVVSLTRDLAFAPLHGAVNPADGLLYIVGLQIWGSDAAEISGVARVRPTGAPFPLPREIVPMTEGVLLRFDLALDPAAATDPANYSAERWDYRRTAAYGSPHFRRDGTRGQETLVPSSAYLSHDGKAVFIGVPDLRPVMQMRLGWTISSRDGIRLSHNAYFTPRELVRFDPEREGFARLTVDLTPRAARPLAAVEVSATEGARLVELMGCVACHSTDGSTQGKVGPSFKGIHGRRREFADGTTAVADEVYLRESIKEPAARVVRGFDRSDIGMPSYEGVLTDPQIEALVLYLKTVR